MTRDGLGFGDDPAGSQGDRSIENAVRDLKGFQSADGAAPFGEGSIAARAITGIEGLARGLEVFGAAATAVDAVNSAATAGQQLASGDAIGAAETVAGFGARLEGGLAGAELGALAGEEIGSLFGPVGAAAGALAGGVLGAVAGVEAAESLLGQFEQALSSVYKMFSGSDSSSSGEGQAPTPGSDLASDGASNLGGGDTGDASGSAETASGASGQIIDPIVLDLTGRGLSLTALSASAPSFDLANTGFARRTGWVGAGTGLLGIDRNGDGKLTSLSDLFGESAGVKDGFAALAALDSNGDGKIDASDSAFTQLRVWVDSNGDGKTDAGELKTLTELGITSINLTAVSRRSPAIKR